MPRNNSARRRATVLIVDDHPAVREALAIRISQARDLEVCGEADDVSNALKLAAEKKPDGAIVDIALKKGNGIDLIKRLKAHNERIRILVWSMFSEELYAERALHAGASGYITKDHATDKILDAIRQVLAGKTYLSPDITDRLVKRAVRAPRRIAESSPIDLLSDQELEVFRLIGQALNTQEIAERLHLSPKTVGTYRDRIRQKLEFRDSSELLRYALQWATQEGGRVG